MHDIQRCQIGKDSHKQHRYDGEILRYIVGNGKCGQCPARHQQLLSDTNNLDQLGRTGVQIHHIACFLCCLCTRIHCHSDICLCKRRCIICSISGHRNQMPLSLVFPNQLQLSFRGCLSDKIIHACFRCDGCGGHRIIPGYHNRFDSAFAQRFKIFLYAVLYDILQINNTEHPMVFSDNQWCSSLLGNGLNSCFTLLRICVSSSLHVSSDRICGTLANFHTVGNIDAGHTGSCGEFDKCSMQLLHGMLTDMKLLFCEYDDTSSLGGFIRQGGQLSCFRKLLLLHPRYALKGNCLPVPQRYRSRFIQQQNIHIPGCFNGTSAHCQYICLIQSGHAGNSDTGHKGADRCRSKTHQQGNHIAQGYCRPLSHHISHIPGNRKQRCTNYQKDDGQSDQQNL